MTTQPTDSTPTTQDIGQSVAAFMLAMRQLGETTAMFSKRPSERNASAVTASADAVDTAIAMLVIAVPQGTQHTRSEVDAWRHRQRMMFGDGGIGVVATMGKVSE